MTGNDSQMSRRRGRVGHQLWNQVAGSSLSSAEKVMDKEQLLQKGLTTEHPFGDPGVVRKEDAAWSPSEERCE